MRRFKTILVGTLGLAFIGLAATPAAAIGPAAIAGATIGGLFLLQSSQHSPYGSHSAFPSLPQSIYGPGPGSGPRSGYGPGYGGHPSSFGHGQGHNFGFAGHGSNGLLGGRPDFYTGGQSPIGFITDPIFGSGHGGPGFAPQHGQSFPHSFDGRNCRSVTDTVTNPAGRPSLVRYAVCLDAFGQPQFVPGSLIVHQTF